MGSNGRPMCKFIRDHITSTFPCQNCGVRERLQFHHVDRAEKHGTINEIIRSHSINRLIAEINKCCLLCNACHIIHHNFKPILNLTKFNFTREELFPLAQEHVTNLQNNRESKTTTDRVPVGEPESCFCRLDKDDAQRTDDSAEGIGL